MNSYHRGGCAVFNRFIQINGFVMCWDVINDALHVDMKIEMNYQKENFPGSKTFDGLTLLVASQV